MKKRFHIFWHSLKKSLVKTSYYEEVVKLPLSFSLKFFFVLLFFVYLIQFSLGAITASFFLPRLPDFVRQSKERLDVFYPKELVVTMQNGKLQTNSKESVFFDIPELHSADLDHMMVIDTDAAPSEYPDLRTLLLFTKDSLVYPDSQRIDLKSYVSAPYDEEESFRIDQAIYTEFKNRLVSFLNILPDIFPYLLVVGVLIGPLISAVIMFGWNMIYLAFLTPLFVLIAVIFKLKWGYKHIFQVLLHASAIPFILVTLLNWLGVYIPFLWTATLLLWMVIILAKVKEEKQ